ncbi:MAG: hypothetical protein J3R72DRAFT_457932 [Linnemannia gamsii]|nr:MAG: hypothetical protein J3R72DRAFT_457932 [Linnemannia gamsii]
MVAMVLAEIAATLASQVQELAVLTLAAEWAPNRSAFKVVPADMRPTPSVPSRHQFPSSPTATLPTAYPLFPPTPPHNKSTPSSI